MNPTYDFTGQVALVTGAASGMGLATAKAFAEAGAAVVLSDINQGALTAATESLAAAGRKVLGVVCDVADEAQAADLVARRGERTSREAVGSFTLGWIECVARVTQSPQSPQRPGGGRCGRRTTEFRTRLETSAWDGRGMARAALDG